MTIIRTFRHLREHLLATAARQIAWFDSRRQVVSSILQQNATRDSGIATAPHNGVAWSYVRSQRQGLADYCLVSSGSAESNVDSSVDDIYLADVTAPGIRWVRCHARCCTIGRRCAVVRKGINDGYLGAGSHLQAFSDLCAYGISLVRGDGQAGEDADDSDDNHQFDQRKALAAIVHCVFSGGSAEPGILGNDT